MLVPSVNTLYLVLFVLISYANAGILQNFWNSFSGDQSGRDREGGDRAYARAGNVTGAISVASARGGHGHYPSHHMTHHGYQHHDQNMDLYQLLGGLSFAGLLGATIIFLARRNTTAGRRRRSLDEDSMAEISDAIEEPWWEKDKVKVEPIRLY